MITTIIANYNYGKYVAEAIQSALDQSIENKIVVVDDGSSDDSIEKILSNFKFSSIYETTVQKTHKCKIWSSDKLDLISTANNGASTARNIAMWHSWNYTKYFAILDADDYILPKKYEKFLKVMEEYDEIGVVYGDYEIARPQYCKLEFKQPYSVEGLRAECIVHSGSMIKKYYLEKIMAPNGEIYDSSLHGPASKGFIGCTEDYDLWLRLSKVCMIVHVPEILSVVNEHGENQSMKMNQNIFRKNLEIIKNK